MRIFIRKHLLKIKQSITNIGGEFDDFVLDDVASINEIESIETALGGSLPEDIKKFAMVVSRRINFNWFLPDDLDLPVPLGGVFSGGLEFNIANIPELEEGRKNWLQECFPNKDDSYDIVWHNKLAFHHVPNGDLLGFDNFGKVVYLSHDDGKGHGYIMASSFSDLIRKWIPLGCPGPEDWQWLPFVSSSELGINPDCDNANQWLKLINAIP